MPSAKHDPTYEQQEISGYQPLGLMITAPAGCGKTEALAFRAKGLLDRFDFAGNGRRLLVVSFTNQAKDNINERLRNYLGTQALRQHVTVCNFHGLAERIICAHGSIVQRGGNWMIAHHDWTHTAIRSLDCDSSTKAAVISILQKTKLECLTDDDVMTRLRATAGQVGDFAVNVEKRRLREQVIPYEDQIRTALWILQDSRVASLYRNHFFAALVDEFQDLTPQQLMLMKALCGDNITYAGDLAQGIFSFAGADAQYVNDEITKSRCKQVKLLKSFRSAPAVLEAVNTLSPLTGSESLTTALPEHWINNGLAAFSSFDNQDEEANWVAKTCQLIQSHCPDHRIGIIARTGFRANSAKQTLKTQEIRFTDWGDGQFSPRVATALREICESMSDASLEYKSEDFRHIRQRVMAIPGESPDQLEDACGWLFDQLSRNEEMRDIETKIQECRGHKTVATSPGIHCLSGHAGKGQQFDWVIIVGLEEGSIPYYKASSDIEIQEEARVLSVMISRARIGVIATRANVDKKRYQKHDSRFLPYLRSMPDLILGRGQIESWFDHADWTSIAKL